MVKAKHNRAKEEFARLGSYLNYRYHSKCDSCGKVFILYTQKDEEPEYYAHIAIACECGGRAYFKLPVN